MDFLFVKKKLMGPQQQGEPLGKQSSCSQEGWKQQRLLQGLLVDLREMGGAESLLEGFDALGRFILLQVT